MPLAAVCGHYNVITMYMYVYVYMCTCVCVDLATLSKNQLLDILEESTSNPVAATHPIRPVYSIEECGSILTLMKN